MPGFRKAAPHTQDTNWEKWSKIISGSCEFCPSIGPFQHLCCSSCASSLLFLFSTQAQKLELKSPDGFFSAALLLVLEVFRAAVVSRLPSPVGFARVAPAEARFFGNTVRKSLVSRTKKKEEEKRGGEGEKKSSLRAFFTCTIFDL